MTALGATPDINPAQADFELGMAAIVSRLLRRLDDGRRRGLFHHDEEADERFPFLEEYQDALLDRAGGDRDLAFEPARWDALSEQLAATTDAHLPLRALANAPFASPKSRDVVMAAALVERDIRLGAVLASLQAPLNSRRPCVGLVGWLLGEEHRPLDVAGDCRRLAAAGVLRIDNPDEPQSEHILRLPPPVLAALQGAPVEVQGVEVRPAETAADLHELVLPDEYRARMARLIELLATGKIDVVVAKGMAGSGRRSLLAALAKAQGYGVLLVDDPAPESADLVGALALLTGSMLVPVVRPGLGAMVEVPAPPAGLTPMGVVSGRTGGVRVAGLERMLVVDVPSPDPFDRRLLWARQALRAPAEVQQEIATSFALTAGAIARVATAATAIATIEGRDEVAVKDVRAASRTVSRQSLESLTTLLPALHRDLRPVLTGDTHAEFEALVLRCRRREEIGAAAGPALSATLNRGVRAMFSGPSGTGKTLTARALAARLKLDVYRVDLAAVVDKYIGETERRLDEVLGRAEELDVVLLLDEGDALMARRTEVRNANDRYANLETNYLLQRLESYEGIVVVTTNAAAMVDSAFLRRLDVVVNFTPPDAAERRAIWTIHLPERCAVSDRLLDDVARRCQLTGGQIRNAALHAVLLSLGAGTSVDDAALTAAVDREYRRAGLTSPLVAVVDAAPSPFERALAAFGRGQE
jgi:hypothetical protein